jgi:peroxiredoxin
MRSGSIVILLGTLLSATLLCAQPDRRAPSFSLPDVNNQQHDLQDYRGKIVLLEIMRTDCPDCAPFAKLLEQIQTHYGGKVAVLSITNPPDSLDMVRAFIKAMNVTYPILFDCGQVAFSYVRPSPLHPSINIPHLYIVDANGIIRGDFEFDVGTLEIFRGGGLYKEIDRLLAPEPPAKK